MTYIPLIKTLTTASVSITGLEVGNDLTSSGNAELGDTATDNVTFSGSLTINRYLYLYNNLTASSIQGFSKTSSLNLLTASNIRTSGLSQFGKVTSPVRYFLQSPATINTRTYVYPLTANTTAKTEKSFFDISTETNKSYYAKIIVNARKNRVLVVEDREYLCNFGVCIQKYGLDQLLVGSVSLEKIYLFKSSSSEESYILTSASNTSLTISPTSYLANQRYGFGSDFFVFDNKLISRADHTGSASDNCGAVYICASGTNGWGIEARLTSSNPQNGAKFGGDYRLYGVQASGNYLFIPEPYYNGTTYQGRLHIFYSSSNSGWNSVQIISASNGKTGDEFGSSVILSGNNLFIGAPQASAGSTTNSYGLVYNFVSESSGWIEKQKISGSLIVTSDGYGSSGLKAQNNYLYVGAKNYGRGLVSIYYSGSNGWQEVQNILGDNIAKQSAASFGVCIEVSGNQMFVGAVNGLGSNTGDVFYFVSGSTGWQKQNPNIYGDSLNIGAINADVMGYDIVLSNNEVFISADGLRAQAISVTTNGSGGVIHYVSGANGYVVAGPIKTATYIKTAKFKNVNGVVSIQQQDTDFQHSELPGTDVNFYASGSNLKIALTGTSEQQISWNGTLEMQSV